MARVKVSLPHEGDCWFFISPQDKVSDFVTAVKEEDPLINSVEVLSGANGESQLAETSMLYEELSDRQTPVFLKVNDMMYRFDSSKAGVESVSLEEKSDWFQQCQSLGIPLNHGSTITTIIQQM